MDELQAPFFVGVNHGLGIRARLEDVAAGEEVVAHVRKIVGFAVVGDPEGAILVGERLVPAFDVDDAQAAIAESYAGLDMEALIVRAAMDDRPAHLGQDLRRNGRSAGHRGDSADAAHGLLGHDFELKKDAEPAPFLARFVFEVGDGAFVGLDLEAV